jgi:hypothetical protein
MAFSTNHHSLVLELLFGLVGVVQDFLEDRFGLRSARRVKVASRPGPDLKSILSVVPYAD